MMTYEGEANQDEEKSDGVGRFSHRGQSSQALCVVPLSPPPQCPRSSYIQL